jgi:hypothetical protein
MMKTRTHSSLLLAMISLTLLCGAQAQTAPTVEATLDESFRDMYNLKFDDALRVIENAKAIDKTDPIPWVAQASAILFREFDRLHILRSDMFSSDDAFDSRPAYSWAPESKKQFDAVLATGEKIAQQRISQNSKDVKALFSLALINGLRADDAALITKRNLSALSYTKSASGYSEKLLALSPDYYDAYVASGMGKYIIGGKAAPVRWMLRLGGLKGDQEQGLKELRMAADHGRYLAPFARILLAFDDLRHKNKTAARQKFASLHDQFPGNPLFTQEMAKCDAVSVSGG